MEAARWNSMCISEQMLNIGGEIERAIERKDKRLSEQYLEKALKLLSLTKADPKNHGRIEEISFVEEELIDFFHENKYKNDKNSLMSYWNSFLSATQLGVYQGEQQ